MKLSSVLVALVLVAASPAFGKDLTLTTQAYSQPKIAVTGGRSTKECDFATNNICKLVFDDELSRLFTDVSGLPLMNDVNPLKIAVARYNLVLGAEIQLPISVLSSEVGGSTDPAEVNALELLDPELGKLNINWTSSWRYHIGNFCKFDAGPRGQCSFATTLGFRYLGLEETNVNGETSNENLLGAYLELSHSWSFPIVDADSGGDAGQLTLKLGAVAFKQNTDDSSFLFPDAVDPSGNPLLFEESYSGYEATLNFYITDKFSVQLRHMKAHGHEILDDDTTFTLSYDISREKK